MSHASGLAAAVRGSTESDTFDLAGQNVATITTNVTNAFRDPLPIQEMIRITFVTGAGKLARQKYDSDAAKAVTSALRELNFEEDRGASCIAECAGCFKMQHDTGKNLKTVVVFPRILENSKEDDDDEDKDSSGNISAGSSRVKMIAVSSLPVFQNMVKSKCWSWSQKKALLNLIETEISSKINDYDNLLMRGQPLTSQQQSFYDNCVEIDAKVAHVKEAMHTQVDQGQITQMELDLLLAQVGSRIAELEKQLSVNKSNKKLATMLEKAKERQTKLKAIDEPMPLPKLKHHAELGRLWKQVAPLMNIQESGGSLLSVAETKQLGKKMELLEQIGDLEEASRGWLEDDETFETRVVTTRREFQAKFDPNVGGKGRNTKGGGNKGSGGGKTTSITSSTKVRGPTKWITPQQKKESAIAAKKKKLNKGDIFGAMAVSGRMADDDDSSSSDDDDDKIDEVSKEQEQTSIAEKQVVATTTTNSPSKKNNKKNKKRKGKKNKNSSGDDDAVYDELDRQIQKKEKKEAKEQQVQDANSNTVFSMFVSIVKFVFSMISSVLVWLIGLLFGTAKSKKRQKTT